MLAESVTGVILAGGVGSRLRSVISDRPKVLAPVGGRPFLAHLLDQLARAKIRNTVLCTGYLGERIPEAIGHFHQRMRITYSHETEPLGTGGAVRLALSRCRTATVLVMNGDSYVEVDLTKYAVWFFEKNCRAALVLSRVPDSRPFGLVKMGGHDVIVDFAEKKAEGGAGWINSGVYLFRKEVLLDIPPGLPFSLEQELLPQLVGSGLYGYRCNGRFLDIGTPESYSSAERFFASLTKVK